MKLVFYSIILNNHQVNVADEFWGLLGDNYRFVELVEPNEGNAKGGTDDYASRPYLIKAWRSETEWQEAMNLAFSADCCVFSGLPALPFEKERMKRGLLSFDMSERWLKRGWVNLFSPVIFRIWLAYQRGGWRRKPLYKLCCSAFAAADQKMVGTFNGRCYKWGYFTQVEKFDVEASSDVSTSTITPLMWCSRYLMWKHPELPILMAQNLKKRGYHFVLDMFGSGEYEKQAKQLAGKLGVEDVVKFRGTMPNEQLMREMRKHDIFLFTSDRNEGWGAVANECMANDCVLVASDAIGSVPYLVKDGVNGLVFRSASTKTSFENPDRIALDDLTGKVVWLLEHKDSMKVMQQKAARTLQEVWSPKGAAHNLLQLIDDLQHGRETSIQKGPCSKA